MQAEPGIVHHQLDGSLGILQSCRDCQQVGFHSQVGLQNLDRDPMGGPKISGGRRQSLNIPRHENQIVAPGGEGFGKRGADAGSCASDEGGRHGDHDIAGAPCGAPS